MKGLSKKNKKKQKFLRFSNKSNKKILISKLKKKNTKFLALLPSFKSYTDYKTSKYNWHNNWQNLHIQYKSFFFHNLISKFLLKHGLYTNKIFIRLNHHGLVIKGTSLGVFKPHKVKKKSKLYIKKAINNKELINLGNFILNTSQNSLVKLKFNHMYLPRKLVEKEGPRVFKRHKKERFFWESLQLVSALFYGYTNASILGGLVYAHTRRNPRRIAFVTYLKRLLDWHYKTSLFSNIQGVRVEVKGRFNAKSRAKKRIISAGRVRIHEKSSNVDYAFTEAITKFGSLGIKVWVCPKN